jgi:predicted amidohydrolase YtcJ
MLLNRWDRSAWLANGIALQRAGLDCARPVPGLECVNGRGPRAAIAAKTFDQRLREARAALQHLSELGVTTIHDITRPTQRPVYTELARRGELTPRVFARPTLDKWNELAYAGISPGFGDDWIGLRALKGFVDGIQGNSTARFYEPQLHSGKRGEWRDSTNTAATDGPGSGMNPPGNMERLLFGLDSAGWWANVHAIGDEAIDSVLTIMEKVFTTNGPKERRWRVIHSQVIRNAAVARATRHSASLPRFSRITRSTTCGGWRSASARARSGRTRSRPFSTPAFRCCSDRIGRERTRAGTRQTR